MLPLLQGAFSELLSYSLSHTLGTRYVALYPYLFMLNVFTRPETHSIGFINGICDPPETAEFSVVEGLDLQTDSSLPVLKVHVSGISVVLGKQFTRAGPKVRRAWGEGEVNSQGKPFVLILP